MAIISKVKNRFNQNYYSKTYNQNDFLLYFIFKKILIMPFLVNRDMVSVIIDRFCPLTQKVKNRFNQDYYSKTYNQNDFLLYFIFQKI